MAPGVDTRYNVDIIFPLADARKDNESGSAWRGALVGVDSPFFSSSPVIGGRQSRRSRNTAVRRGRARARPRRTAVFLDRRDPNSGRRARGKLRALEGQYGSRSFR